MIYLVIFLWEEIVTSRATHFMWHQLGFEYYRVVVRVILNQFVKFHQCTSCHQCQCRVPVSKLRHCCCQEHLYVFRSTLFLYTLCREVVSAHEIKCVGPRGSRLGGSFGIFVNVCNIHGSFTSTYTYGSIHTSKLKCAQTCWKMSLSNSHTGHRVLSCTHYLSFCASKINKNTWCTA